MNMLNIALLCLSVVALGQTRNTPPAINLPQGNKWPEPRKYIRTGPNNAQSFICKATANPPATYTWTQNGIDLAGSNPLKVSYNKTTGFLTTGEYFSTLDNNGDYQCIASNTEGTAMTPYINLLATRGETFPGVPGLPRQVEEYVSNYLKLDCENVPPSVPQWEFSWEKGFMDSNNELNTSVIQRDHRMLIDPEGNLHFLWVEQQDNKYMYTCTAYNHVMKLEVKNTLTYQLTVKQGATPDRKPDLKYSSDVVVMAGNSAKLTCIFSYYSSAGEFVVIDWYLHGEKVVSNGTNMQHEGHTLLITNVQVPLAEKNQSEKYQCEARIANQPANHSWRGEVALNIIAPPQFIKDMEPVAINVPKGKDAVFKCSTVSHNSHKKPTTWLVNGKPLLGCPPHMFECNVTKNDGSSICINEILNCNNDPDCPDNSDELNCNFFVCAEGKISCNGKCIPLTEQCEKLICAYPSFQCPDNPMKCLTYAMLCNGVKDCNDGSDEQACPDGQTIKVGRFQFNSQRTELRLPKVELQDTMCFQCMVSNEYGVTLGDGCITVIDNIELLTELKDIYYVEPGMKLTLSVNAKTDELWQHHMKFQWYLYRIERKPDTGEEYEVEEQLPKSTYHDYIAVSQTGKNFTLSIPDVSPDNTQAYKMYTELTNHRQFSLVIEHKYDRLTHNFTVIGKNIAVPPDKIPVVEAASTNIWFIALILVILIFFIVVALIMCYMYRNRGDTYLLDKKEHQAGHDPEKELKESEFRDVGRVVDDLDSETKGENASLAESVKPYDSDEDNTEEFEGDFDVSKFNEDGSFIGLYGDKKSKYLEPKEATV